VVQHALNLTVARTEHTRGHELVRADLDVVAPASPAVLAGEESASLPALWTCEG